MKCPVTQDLVKTLLDYDQDTGVFVWKRRGNPQFDGKLAGKIAGAPNVQGYIRIAIYTERYLAHRLAWLYVHGEWPKVIDHVNGVNHDNRIRNLRSGSQMQNTQNMGRKSSNTSGFPGVSWHKQVGKWCANITVGGKHISLGLYNDKQDAFRAYLEAKSKFHPTANLERITS